MTSARIRELRKELERARARLDGTRSADYRRPQDFRRALTVQTVTIRRVEKQLADAEAGLRERLQRSYAAPAAVGGKLLHG